jgi:DNA repair protein RadC
MTIKEGPSFTVRDLPHQERPRERLVRFGAEALSSQELLAILIGRGVAQRSVMNIAQELISKFGSVKGVSEASIEELSRVKGVGLAKAAQIRACFELGKRQELAPREEEYDISSPRAVAKRISAEIKDKAKEHFKLILLNTRNKVIRIAHISTGTLNASLVHPREVFVEAIRHHASSVVIAHNHPSGDTVPSEEDIRITRRLVEAGRLLGIEVLDHVIVGRDEPFSFKEKGLI